MSEPIDLELAFFSYDLTSCFVESRASIPNDNQLDEPQTARIRFPIEDLTALHSDPLEYGHKLTQIVFADERIKTHFREAQQESEKRTEPPDKFVPMRIRIRIDRTAQPLERCLWETLEDPETGTLLSTNQNIYFSRFLARNDARGFKLRAKGRLSALIAISSPSDIGPGNKYPKFSVVDFEAEAARVHQNLAPGVTTILFPKDTPLTVNNLLLYLKNDPDILYLVCHGGQEPTGDTFLCLQKENQETDFVKGSTFARRLSEQLNRPRLVVMVSCNSAGDGLPLSTDDSGVLAKLGPPITDCGVPAVIAMQGNVTMKTIEMFMPVFFRELGAHGQLDRAMAAARSHVQEEADFFSPALFMRLSTGRLWSEYEPDLNSAVKWNSIIAAMVEKKCTPVLGSGLLEPLIGEIRATASRLACQYNYPMSDDSREDLPQVTQFIETIEAPATMRVEVRTEFARQLIRRFGLTLPEILKGQPFEARLQELELGNELTDLLSKCWPYIDRADAPLAHRLLAKIKFQTYITTAPDVLLENALVENGRKPLSWVYDRKSQEKPAEIADYIPDLRCPLVVHLFGTFDLPDLLVLSEDNYFEYLTDVQKQDPNAKKDISAIFTSHTLLFLGFHLREWDFRVLLRSIQALEGHRHNANTKRPHVAVQVDPSEAQTSAERIQAKKFLEMFFQNANITIFYGSIEEFLTELIRRLGGQLVQQETISGNGAAAAKAAP